MIRRAVPFVLALVGTFVVFAWLRPALGFGPLVGRRASPNAEHYVFHTPLRGADKPGTEVAYFGMGCFWGAERMFWKLPGVVSTAVGYAGGTTNDPSYEEVSTSRTGHAEVVRVVYDPKKVGYGDLLKVFWEGHDPTQGMRQGNDHGTQYRSLVLTTSPEQRRLVAVSRDAYQRALTEKSYGKITTEIKDAAAFTFAEDYHQQYLAKNPNGYCGHGGTGVTCPSGLDVDLASRLPLGRKTK